MKVATIGLDMAKQVFQEHGADNARQTLFRRKLKRDEVGRFFSGLETVVCEAVPVTLSTGDFMASG
jgi:hypothetical protein